ncbi:MAG: phytanoyl-CoA dioxygenase family protein [Chitinophagaceae bacterium]|nr:phytanoyl-CoA dioxygenase family protein [Chitinophagaceae bacterium]
MEKKLSPPVLENEERSLTFASEGFIVLKNFLTKEEVSLVSKEVECVLASCRESACVRPNNTLLPLRWNDILVELLLKFDKRIQMLKKAVAAKDLKWVSGYVSTKDAFSPALWWHQDWWCWQHDISIKRTTAQIAVMCYLTPTSKQNGALRVLPGSHHRSTGLHAFLPEAHATAANQIQQEHPAMSDYPGQITLNLNAGDAVAIDYRLLHGTHGNASAIRRDCVMLTFAPSWQDLPADIKGHLIDHYALPFIDELPVQTPYPKDLLPTFYGIRKDLELNRMAPSEFECTE